MKRIALALAVLLMTAPYAFALDETVIFRWTPPGYFMSGTDCNSTEKPLGTAASEVLYEIHYTVNGGEDHVAVSAAVFYEVRAAVGASIYFKTGPFFQGGAVGCWAEKTYVVPIPTPCRGGSITVELK